MNIEKDWTTKAGLRAVVLATSMGHRCGYVGVPLAHQHYGKHYDDSGLYDIEVHGGLTYSSEEIGKYPVESDLHWFGFDCAHYMDAKDASIMDETHRMLHETYPRLDVEEAVVRDLPFCERECEKLAEQLGDVS